MGIFTRMKDIVGANINAMLEKAEDPEKLVKMMIREMEDTLVEIKASCAGAMATEKRVIRDHTEVDEKIALWQGRAKLAVEKGKEDLAKEALLEKRRYQEKRDALEQELSHTREIVEQYRKDISQLEDKLNSAREKHRVLVQRHIHAQRKTQAQKNLRRYDTSDAWARFENFESRIDRMEAEADLVNAYRKPDLSDKFKELEGDEDLDDELNALKAEVDKSQQD